MKLIATLVAAASVAVLAASGAQATAIFLLTFSDPNGSTTGLTLDAQPDGGGQYTINKVTGEIDGNAVSLLPQNGFQGNDNTLNFPFSNSNGAFDMGGVSLSAGGYDYNLWWDSSTPDYYLYRCPGGSCGFDDGNLEVTSFSLTEIATPEPTTWALMLAGIAGLGAALRARRGSSALA